jgi:hypothetical protein
MVLRHATNTGQQVLCADIGGATTDLFSVFRNQKGEPIFNRTVSANLGMSYSIANVLVEAGVEKIARWLPYQLDHRELRDRLRNKMIRPTSIPQTMEDLLLEQAVCREALRLSLAHHRSLAVGLSGVTQRRGIADIFSQRSGRNELVDMMKLDLVIGSGGVLSHAPNRLSAALMMLDGFELQGVTSLAVDSIFMMPHLGVLASVHPEAAQEIFLKDCLVHIGPSVVPVYSERSHLTRLATVSFDGKQIGAVERGVVALGELPVGVVGILKVVPESEVDVGAGPGIVVERKVPSGIGTVFFDGRNRPIVFPAEITAQREQQARIHQALGL